MKIITPILLIILSSCSMFQSRPVLPLYETRDVTVYPGKVKRLSIKIPSVGQSHRLSCGNKELVSAQEGDTLQAFFSVSYKYLEKNSSNIIPCYLQSNYGREVLNFHVFNMNVKPWPYPKSFIKVNKKHVDLSKKNLNRFLKEKAELKKVYGSLVKDKRLYTKPFIRPLKSKITGVYGSRRVFNNKKDSWHSGTDFRARTPTPIPASNDGIVVHAKHLFFNGNAVFIDHGMGVITMYCHLSKISVKPGDIIKRGQIIGISGNTGRSSAPHLHWGVRIQNNWVDGLQFIEEQASLLESSYQSTSNKK